jgi:hypothetical protein
MKSSIKSHSASESVCNRDMRSPLPTQTADLGDTP